MSGPDRQRLGWIQVDKEPQGIQWIRRLAEAHPDQFKTKLAPTDKVEMSRIYGYEKGVALDIEDRTKPEACFDTTQIPPQYRKQAEELYLEEIRAGCMRLIQQKCYLNQHLKGTIQN